ncbi:Transcription initiation factor IIE subunit alpha N-terminal domain-containing protein [Entamoeba marina]
MSFDSIQQQNLLDKILRRVVAMFLEPQHLIVLLEIQRSNEYKTEKDISENVRMPIGLVSQYLKALQDYKIIKHVMFYPETAERKKQSKAFYIEYDSAIDDIIYRYCKILKDLTESRSSEQVNYICTHCNIPYKYEECIDYMDVDGHFYCPECDGKLFLESHNSGANEGNRKLNSVNSNFKELKHMLEQLSSEYNSKQDYPHYTLPTNTVTNSSTDKRSGHSRTKDNDINNLPWELDWADDIEKQDTIVSGFGEDVMDIDSVFNSVIKEQHEFIHPSKAFHKTEKSKVVSSNKNSPVAPQTIVRVTCNKKNKAVVKRSVSTQL